MSYPILVERFTGKQALIIICERCHTEEVIGPDDLLNEGLYACPVGCPGSAIMKFEEAERCKGCGRLGFWDGPAPLNGCCSSRCALQAEYAATLKATTGEVPR